MTQLSKPLQHIAALVPQYTNEGDVTLVLCTDGSCSTRPSKVQTVLRQLAKAQATDLTLLRQHSRRQTHSRLHQPLPLAPQVVLCPLKLRRPRIAGDSTTGYVNCHTVLSVKEADCAPYPASLTLQGGHVVPAFWTAPTIRRHLQQARVTATPGTPYDAAPAISQIAQKLVEIITDILALKQEPPR